MLIIWLQESLMSNELSNFFMICVELLVGQWRTSTLSLSLLLLQKTNT